MSNKESDFKVNPEFGYYVVTGPGLGNLGIAFFREVDARSCRIACDLVLRHLGLEGYVKQDTDEKK